MSYELAQVIIAGVGALLTAASAYYAQQQALPAKTKRETCQNLLRLKNALKDIGHTGHDIGRLMRMETFTPGNPDLERLIFLLEEQNRNLIKATSEFKSLAEIFDIHAPDLSGLIIHLRGKSDRIELVYSVASDSDVRNRLRASLEPWEKSTFLGRPHSLIPIVLNSNLNEPIGPAEIMRHEDENFGLILDCIPQLTGFIQGHCPMEYLR